MGFLNERERRVLTVAATHLLPYGPDPVTAPGVNEAGVVDYVDQLPSALDHDPPRIWAGGPISDRAGSDTNHFLDVLPLGRLEELTWRMRLEGSRGQPERELRGPVRGWQEVYREGLTGLGRPHARSALDERGGARVGPAPLHGTNRRQLRALRWAARVPQLRPLRLLRLPHPRQG